MKSYLLNKFLFAGSLLLTLSVYSQEDERSGHNQWEKENTTYAVTDSVRNGIKWNFVRTLDIRTGNYSNILVRLLNNNELQPPPGTPNTIQFNAVAAMAYDRENKRLYYTAMFTDKLYYIDLRNMQRRIASNQFTGLLPKAVDQSNIITRMVIAADGKGYALTNDARHFIRFRTNNNPSVTDLGSLVDAPGNNEMSVHNLCSSFGGDLVADDDDHLYLITSRNHVFRIDIRTKVAKYLGTVSNLPQNFTTSGVVADKSGEKIVLVSATDSSDIYTVHVRTLVAKRVNADRARMPADLANGYVLDDDEHHHHHNNWPDYDDHNDNRNVRLFPNPVTNNEFRVEFTNANAGTYAVRVTDVNGKLISSKSVTISGKDNSVLVNLPPGTSSGIYSVRITDKGNNVWYSGKILVR